MNHKDIVLQSARQNNIQLNQEALLLIHGVKPALLSTMGKVPNKRTEMLQFLQSFYPTIGFPHRGNSVMIFHSGKEMLNFTKDGLVSIESHTRETSVIDYNYEQLGIYLGYPPAAAKWFVNNFETVDGKVPERVSINYHGVQFVCSKELIRECLDWMDDNRPVPEEIQTQVSLGGHSLKDRRKTIILNKNRA